MGGSSIHLAIIFCPNLEASWMRSHAPLRSRKDSGLKMTSCRRTVKCIFRIGVNLGDVIQDEDRIYGDGVNIASRIEGLADPGGVSFSGTAFIIKKINSIVVTNFQENTQ